MNTPGPLCMHANTIHLGTGGVGRGRHGRRHGSAGGRGPPGGVAEPEVLTREDLMMTPPPLPSPAPPAQAGYRPPDEDYEPSGGGNALLGIVLVGLCGRQVHGCILFYCRTVVQYVSTFFTNYIFLYILTTSVRVRGLTGDVYTVGRHYYYCYYCYYYRAADIIVVISVLFLHDS